MSSRDQNLRRMFRELRIQEITDELVETTPLLDFDGQHMNLFLCQYKMNATEPPMVVVVKKGTEQEKVTPRMYRNLFGLNHHLLLPVINYYEKGHGMLVLGNMISGSLDKWLDQHGGDLMFQGTEIERRFSPTLRALLIDLKGLFSKMSQKKLYPTKVTFEDLFVNIVDNGPPKILMLLTQFRELGSPYFTTSQWQQIWTSIDAIIEKMCNKCGCQLKETSKQFLSYLQKSDNIQNITYYPDVWSIDDKAAYLYNIIRGLGFDRDMLRSQVNFYSNIDWPCYSNGHVIQVIQQILYLPSNLIREPNGNVKSKYNTDYVFDYIQLCRNTHKHFYSLPQHIQDQLGGSRESFIEMIEHWDEDIWIKLYEIFGCLGR